MVAEVHADSLAALMVLDPTLEPVPEPFRMQPAVWMYVDYEQYLAFIRSLPENTHLLYNPTAALKAAMERRDTAALLKAFYIDMACAVGKELSFAEAEHRRATHIRHTLGNTTAHKEVVVTSTTVLTLQQILLSAKFPIGVPSASNMGDWAYACKLLQDASSGPTFWVEE